ncbi:hypothetical protein D3C85_1660050 [compost metagenome]
MEFSHLLKWAELDDNGEWTERTRTFHESYDSSGSAKVQLDPATLRITAVPSIMLDTYEYTVTEGPRYL